MPKVLTDSLEKFDLNDFNLSSFFSEVAIDLDNLNKKSYNQLNENYHSKISKAAEILRNKSREFRTGKENLEDKLFFWNFYGKEENKENMEVLYADRLLVLSENLLIAKNLPVEKIGELAGICVRLSEKAREYWNENNPNGFKKY